MSKRYDFTKFAKDASVFDYSSACSPQKWDDSTQNQRKAWLRKRGIEATVANTTFWDGLDKKVQVQLRKPV